MLWHFLAQTFLNLLTGYGRAHATGLRPSRVSVRNVL